jgi:hypothetical protein
VLPLGPPHQATDTRFREHSIRNPRFRRVTRLKCRLIMTWNPWKLRRLLKYTHGVIESLDGDLTATKDENRRLREEITRLSADVRLEDAIRQWLATREAKG